MSDFEKIEFCINKNQLSGFHVAANHIKNRLKNFINPTPHMLRANPYNNVFYVNAPSSCDIVFSYGAFPIQYNSSNRKPVICEQSYAFGGRIEYSKWKSYLRESRKFYVERSDLLVTPSPESMTRFKEVFPQYEHKIRVIPYFLPYLKAIEPDQFRQKYFASEKIRVLFVGKEARRKGLDSFIEAYKDLPKDIKEKFEVTVVSKFLDGKLSMPEEFVHKTYVKDLTAEYRKAHLLVFLTKREAYGLVLVEAMAAGCTVLTTDHPIQKSIMNNTGGWFVDPFQIDKVHTTLLEIAETPQQSFFEMGEGNIRNFITDKAPEIVSKKYYNMFAELVM